MKRKLIFLTSTVLLMLFAMRSQAQNKWYVDSSATGTNNGSSWADAFKYLSDATAAAQSSATTDTIFVAKGTYYPNGAQSTGSTASRDTAFIFTRDNLAVLGGYPSGGGTRNAPANPTVLSGRINADTTLASYHIIICAGTSAIPLNSTLVLDGFKVTQAIGSNAGGFATININTQAIPRNMGGGMYNVYAAPTITNNSFVQLKSSYGAGIYNNTSSPRIINSVISGNFSNNTGSGISNYNSSPVISSVVISGNGIGAAGGSAVANESVSNPRMTNVTITGNESYAIRNESSSGVKLKNCIIYYNGNSNVNPISNSGLITTTIANCILQGTGSNSGSNWDVFLGTDLGNNINKDPAFVTPLYFPALSVAGNFQLKLASPAVAKGDTTGVSQYLPVTDVAGNPRITGIHIDRGAYEYLPAFHVIYVDSSATAGTKTGDSWANAFTSLSFATNVAANEFLSFDTILIAKGTYYPSTISTSTLRDSTFLLTRSNLAILGGYPSGGSTIRNWNQYPVLLNGTAGTSTFGSENLFHVMIVTGTPAAVIDSSLIIDGLTLTKGNAYYSSGYSYYDTINGQLIQRSMGGGLHIRYASPTVRNCNISGNKGDYGAGIYLYKSRTLFVNTSIKGNQTGSLGAAMYSDSASFTMANCVVSGNVSLGNGGIATRYSNPTIVNTTITGNYSYGGNGAGMYSYFSNPVVKNSIIYGNTPNIFNTSSSPVFSHSIIESSGGSAAWIPATGIDSGFNINTNPNFAVPVAPSGTESIGGNFQILIGSPAINAGDTAGISQYLPGIDMWNNPRIVDGQIDMGAYEFEMPAHILYVDSSAVTGNNKGSDWANAFTSLVVATNVARAYPNVDSILVAKGTYYPTGSQAGINRDASFVFSRDSLIVLGGYPSGGGIVRNSTLNVTTLSGNIGSSTLSNDNSHHVIVAAGTNVVPLDSTLRIDGFTITDGNANIDTGSVLFNNQAIARNIGAGMVNFYAAPSLSNLIITKDTATGNGGGMYNFHSSPVITYGNFSLNTAKNGGAIFDTASSSPVITSGIFRGNRATNHGGGMYNISSSSPKISNSLFSGNNAASNGGAILNSTTSSPTIVNTTIASNFAVNLGGGIINLAASAPVIKNSIVYANNSGITNVSSNPVVSYSIMQDGGYPGSNNNINQNPLFQTPLLAANVPSIAGNFQLLGGSPAINAGDTTGVSQYLPLYDLIGFHRILGTNIDRGGYEYVRALYVDSSIAIAGKGTSWTDAYKYLSDATNSARNVHAIDTIFAAKGTYYPTGQQSLSNRDTSFIFTRSGTILMGGYPNGGGVRDWVANPTILSGDIGTANDSTDNTYHVLMAVGTSSATPLTNTLKIDGVTITRGNASNNTGTVTINGVAVPRNFGGGMLNYFASPSLSNVIITKNGANSGGGMYSFTSSPSITDVTISANKATVSGGGLYHSTSTSTFNNVKILSNISLGTGGGIATNGADLVISNSAIQDNKATTTGGGIHTNVSTPAFTITNTYIEGNTALTNGGGINIVNTGNTAALILDYSVVNRNTAGNNGGGIANLNAAPTIKNTKISGNTASTTFSGGGIYNATSSPVITNTVITGNKATNGGGIANAGTSSAPKVINTAIAANNATNGGGVYNFNTAIPMFKNSIIANNNTGVVNSAVAPLAKPVFSYSIIQGSGGSGAGWVAATGVDSGFNKAVNPNFVNSASFTTAPDTSGNYSITICSRAANMGDTARISQYITTSDLAGVARFNGKIDAGAYEIDTLNPASLYIPSVGGIYTSNRTFQQGNLTHFCNCDSNKLLVTLDTLGTGVILTDTSAKVRAGTAVAAYYQAGSGFVTNPDGTAVFNREWAVLPVAEPTSPVTVYAYYTDSDYVSVNNVMNSLMLTPLVSDTQMYFYKVTDTSLGLFPSIFDIGINQVQIITYGPSPSINNWVSGTLGDNKYAEYKVNSFSGGGGGGSSAGAPPVPSTPLPLEILSFTGTKYTDYNMLHWNISDDITDWELSRSTNSIDFKVLSKGVAGIRNFKDERPEKDVNYYRLKVNSRLGRQSYSSIVMIKNNPESSAVALYPIPATHSITIRCSNNAFIGQKIIISDNVGKVVYTAILQSESNVDISSWTAGMYHLKLPDGSSIKLVKE